ncbi:hypothetical protein EXE10_16100 [Acinetobacter sp. WCHAc060033]|uniref:ornithine uptake porin CarO n=1 Tax=Acinetobacter sp. WCHAc060033 TaxID=2518624 RepID=UPI001023A71E|nr:ornithine uptake porin CarO [Acinetobacter sp. WCHAc060033]RZG79125.1 hypothetical protein EXE10_16100 [Acinetobacter sp. WCHAc060033]
MKVLKVLTVATALLASGVAMADEAVVNQGNVFNANQLLPTGARLEVGTTGYGGALLWTANPYVGLALGYNGGDISWSDDIKVNGSKYDLDMDNKLAYLNAEIRPWGASQNVWAQGLYVAAGVGYIDNEYGLERKVSPGRNFTVNHTDFQAGADGVHIKGQQNYDNDFAPYVGFGFAPKITKNIGVFGEVGAYYTGNPSVKLERVSGSATSNIGGNLDNELAKEQYKIANDDKYEWMPVGKVGISYNW